MSVLIEKPCWGMTRDGRGPYPIVESRDPAYPWQYFSKDWTYRTVTANGAFIVHEENGEDITRILTGPEYPPHIPLDPSEWPPAPVEYCEWQGVGRYEDEHGKLHTYIWGDPGDWYRELAIGGEQWLVPAGNWRMVRFDKPLKSLLED